MKYNFYASIFMKYEICVKRVEKYVLYAYN